MSIAQNPASTRGKLDFSAEINMHGSTAHADPAPVIVPPLRCSSETEYGCYDYQLWLPVIEVSA